MNTFNFGEEFIEEETFKWVTARKNYLKDKKKDWKQILLKLPNEHFLTSFSSDINITLDS